MTNNCLPLLKIFLFCLYFWIFMCMYMCLQEYVYTTCICMPVETIGVHGSNPELKVVVNRFMQMPGLKPRSFARIS